MVAGYLRSARHRLGRGVQKALYWSGAGGCYVRAGRVSGAVVLMYHSVLHAGNRAWVDPANAISESRFAAQMRFLRERRQVIAMGELVTAVTTGCRLAPGTVVITFDDGYLDNLHIAAPILARYGLPAVLYLPTGYIGEARTQWIDELYTMFAHRGCHDLHLPSHGRETRWDLRHPVQRARAYAQLRSQLIVATRPEREAILRHTAGQLRPDARPPRLTMTWDEVRRVTRQYPLIEIGAHTVDHLDLTAHGEQLVRDQLKRCIGDIGHELRQHPRHFSFPYARSTEQVRRMVQEMGFCTAVAAGRDYLIGKSTDLFAIARIAAPESPTLFRFHTSGAYPELPRLLRMRA